MGAGLDAGSAIGTRACAPQDFLELEKPDKVGGVSLPPSQPRSASGGVLSEESPWQKPSVTGSENSPRGLVPISEMCDVSHMKRHFAVIIYVEEKY